MYEEPLVFAEHYRTLCAFEAQLEQATSLACPLQRANAAERIVQHIQEYMVLHHLPDHVAASLAALLHTAAWQAVRRSSTFG
ncbi:MAG: hypothetical protein MUD01_10150 [Chloroflexaceae bacterium]|nr:hypothetical protein [Chloroflexaceae bacterium]